MNNRKRKVVHRSIWSDNRTERQKTESLMAYPGIFVRGWGVQVSLTKNALTTFFLSPQLILQKSNGQKEREKTTENSE